MSSRLSELLQPARIEEPKRLVDSPAISSRTVFYTYLALFGVILCVYAGVAGCDFIHVDDTGYVHHNRFVRPGFTWENVKAAFTSFHGSLWIPLTWISLMLDVSLFGVNPMGFHIENVLWHGAAALLLLHGLHRATGRFWPSVIVASLFGLHPINVESVAWITERKNVLCAFFWILSTNAYLKYGATAQKRSYGMALAWFGLALMSKPMAVTLPGVLFLLDLWPLRRDVKRWRSLIIEKIPFIALSVGACLLAMHAPHERNAFIDRELLPLAPRISNAIVSYVSYLRDLFWPANLAMFYPHPYEAQPLLAGMCLGILLAISGGVIWFYRSRPYLLVGWCWFLGVLVPMLGLVQVGAQGRADRFTYLSQIGVFIAVVWGIADLHKPHWRRLVSIITVTALLALGGRTAVEVQYWTDTTTLLERALEKAGPSYFAAIFAARGRARQKDDVRAVEHFKTALSTQSGHPDAWHDYGCSLLNLKEHGRAIKAFSAAIFLDPKDAESRYRLATTLDQIGLQDAAIAQFREIINLNATSPSTREMLGRLLLQRGLYEEAQYHLKQAEQIRAAGDSKSKPAEGESQPAV